MNDSLYIRVYEGRQLIRSGEFTEPVELGRQRENEESDSPQRLESGEWRFVIAPLSELSVGRRHLRLECLPNGGVSVTNLSRQNFVLHDSDLKPQSTREITAPVVLTLGTKTVLVDRQQESDQPLHSLAQSTVPPGSQLHRQLVSQNTLSAMTDIDMDSFVRWLQTTTDVLMSAASSTEFFGKASQAVVDLVGLETGCALVLQHGEWKLQSLNSSRAGAEENWVASRHVLNSVRQQKRTFWQFCNVSGLAAASLRDVQAVVAAPILNREGTVIGALYGDRRRSSEPGALPKITKLEAMLVELLACGVAAGLARLELEEAALRARVQFEQFFTRELSDQLASQPDLLKGRDLEVTVLFCDLRGFSRISERLGPAATVDWISDCMGALSNSVIAHRGVLVDYIGDELMAMWGAPVLQADQAKLACQAAIGMLAKVPALNEKWSPILKEPMGLGIGINTGVARVGNVGSPRKFKYGPLGNTVNLASRVQGATKYLGTPLLVTGSTHTKLDPSFRARRLCQVRVVNIVEPVDLYELLPNDWPGWPRAKLEYETALEQFQQQNFRMASQVLGNLRAEFPDDGPALVLLSRAVDHMVKHTSKFDPVWELPGK